ncbi:hypothetical protein TUBRATIS_20400 [Tubulinosema ratisbonensis]|uniref:Uncharacterized protein n=1 Tax=Tubulinosema ratisbonensis TaxID=291195 RepID=A0A437AJY8_9MICR|nr:hypothetical protein TUBRATIS_20400 [Tubulinosema ratisbonensis]
MIECLSLPMLLFYFIPSQLHGLWEELCLEKLYRISKECDSYNPIRRMESEDMGKMLIVKTRNLKDSLSLEKFFVCYDKPRMENLQSHSFIVRRMRKIFKSRFNMNPISHQEFIKRIEKELNIWRNVGKNDETVANVFARLLTFLLNRVEDEFMI